jgi:hypothetical protein
MPSLRLDIDNPMNLGVIRYLAERTGEEQVTVITTPGSAAQDPYWHMGSHPEAVKRVRNQLGSVLPETCYCLLYGTPARGPNIGNRSGVCLWDCICPAGAGSRRFLCHRSWSKEDYPMVRWGRTRAKAVTDPHHRRCTALEWSSPAETPCC